MISLQLLAISEANGLFVLSREFSKSKVNSFREREKDKRALPLPLPRSGENTSRSQLGGPITTNEYLFFICLLVAFCKKNVSQLPKKFIIQLDTITLKHTK